VEKVQLVPIVMYPALRGLHLVLRPALTKRHIETLGMYAQAITEAKPQRSEEEAKLPEEFMQRAV